MCDVPDQAVAPDGGGGAGARHGEGDLAADQHQLTWTLTLLCHCHFVTVVDDTMTNDTNTLVHDFLK